MVYSNLLQHSQQNFEFIRDNIFKFRLYFEYNYLERERLEK